jgi:hypothetical protein
MKHIAYLIFDGRIFGIKRGQCVDEYGSGGRTITESSRARIWNLLAKCEVAAQYSSYGTPLHSLYVYSPLDKKTE